LADKPTCSTSATGRQPCRLHAAAIARRDRLEALPLVAFQLTDPNTRIRTGFSRQSYNKHSLL
jgi:hypothetical protein